jgi:hypothetical protein
MSILAHDPRGTTAAATTAACKGEAALGPLAWEAAPCLELPVDQSQRKSQKQSLSIVKAAVGGCAGEGQRSRPPS